MKSILIFLILFQTILSAKIIYSNSSHNDATTINKIVSALSNQLTQNKDFINIQESSIAITSFVCLDNFKATSRLSNILSENLIHEMQVRGYRVIDFKTMGNIQVDSKGDFLFSRNIEKLKNSLNVNYALTGTYFKYKSGTVVNARIIELTTHVVLSTAQVFIPKRVIKNIDYVGHQILNFEPHHISLVK